jgi:hypothetical protein
MFWVTQAGWARAAGMSDTADINVPARTANTLLIVFSRTRRVSLARLHDNYAERPAGGQVDAAALVWAAVPDTNPHVLSPKVK